MSSTTPPPHPPMLRYTDGQEIDHEIFIAPGRYQEALDLIEAEDWDALSKFPPYSDMPPLKVLHANNFTYYDDDGTSRSVHLPDDDGKSAQRATALWEKKDWEALKREFEPWAGQPRADAAESAEWERGVERCAKARDEQTKAHDEQGGSHK